MFVQQKTEIRGHHAVTNEEEDNKTLTVPAALLGLSTLEPH